jgi:hypothetical protein
VPQKAKSILGSKVKRACPNLLYKITISPPKLGQNHGRGGKGRRGEERRGEEKRRKVQIIFLRTINIKN